VGRKEERPLNSTPVWKMQESAKKYLFRRRHHHCRHRSCRTYPFWQATGEIPSLDTTLEEDGEKRSKAEESKLKPKDCDCTGDCEDDFHDEVWEDGYRLNTCNPSWERVFPSLRGRCRFCRKNLPTGPESEDECEDCDELSTFQLVKKYAHRWRYPNH